MQSQEFWVNYMMKQAIPIDTHYIGENERKKPLISVAHLISAYKTINSPELDEIPLSLLTLHLPAGFTRKDCAHLGSDAFFSEDDNETRLRPDLPLASLGSIGSEYASPLIIKVDIQTEQVALATVAGNWF